MKVRSQLGLQIKNQTFRRWLIHSLSFSATTTLADVVPKENLIFSAMKLDLYSHADAQSEEQKKSFEKPGNWFADPIQQQNIKNKNYWIFLNVNVISWMALHFVKILWFWIEHNLPYSTCATKYMLILLNSLSNLSSKWILHWFHLIFIFIFLIFYLHFIAL